MKTIVEFDNTSIDTTDYEWSFEDDSEFTTQVSPAQLFPDEESGVYLVQLIATSPLGCADTAYAEISIE